MTHTSDPLARAQNTAHEWLATVGEALGTTDRRYTYRVLRAWLHTLRDRLTVEGAAHFAAQLPEFLRGTFYDGWVPSKVPIRYDCDDCIDRIASEATVRRADVRPAVRGVSEGMRELLSPGSLDHALGHLPRDLREMFAPGELVAGGSVRSTRGDEELRELRHKVEFLAGAVLDLSRELSGGQRPRPGDREPGELGATNEMMLPQQGFS
ncbi:DUF2267 domain-containing protein [Saccharomonospora xinjiangensis]|uniref:DUF2267 domain-containing protein n=1 Tax=Saccharomonospora xinjiangensis XJ-54 TaxID=882086 RepID=I0UY82_9PSEU|nr:DUF2267 domain-containing protein [Saccharomonospora xinjiangensis]EID52835.1 hypothetical protein SacxiDRAFT_0562 [Saccharomonospora xinjiangensis XJ-54]